MFRVYLLISLGLSFGAWAQENTIEKRISEILKLPLQQNLVLTWPGRRTVFFFSYEKCVLKIQKSADVLEVQLLPEKALLPLKPRVFQLKLGSNLRNRTALTIHDETADYFRISQRGIGGTETQTELEIRREVWPETDQIQTDFIDVTIRQNDMMGAEIESQACHFQSDLKPIPGN